MIRLAAFLLLALTSLLFITAPAMAADSRADVEARIKARFAKLEKYRDAGKIGEVYDGTTQAVTSDAASDQTLKSLMSEENSDRKALFILIAKEENPNADQATIDKVATTYARKLFELAKDSHYLKGKSGKWVKKADIMNKK